MRVGKTAVPVAAVAAVLVALLGPKAHALTGAQIAQYVAAVLAGASAILHKEHIKHGIHRLPHPKPRPKPPGPSRFTTVWDSVTISALGRVASTSRDAMAAYIDGRYANLREVQRDYPRHLHYTIAVFAGDDADFLDVETSDATPEQVPDWIRRQQRRLGIKLGPNRPLCKWVADPTEIPHIPNGYQGCQWNWHARNPSGVMGNLDESLFYTGSLERPIIGIYANGSTWARIYQVLEAAGMRGI